METEYRKLASIQKISNLSPIEGADRIEAAKILGWTVVVKKGEFQVGDSCVYFEIDSLLKPEPWNDFLQKKKGTDPIRLRTIRLKGVLSQGLALSPLMFNKLEGLELFEGMDVTTILDVTKWEPATTFNAKDQPKGNFPHYVPKTDTLRIQAYPNILTELYDLEVYGTIKVDGTSTTFYFKDGTFGACSRNLELKDVEGSKYWEMAKKYDIEAKLKAYNISTGKNIAIQCETYGPTIQKNPLDNKAVEIAVFDIWDIDNQKYFDYFSMVSLCQDFNIPMVKTVYLGRFNFESVEDVLHYADDLTYPNGSPAEGIVFRPTVEAYSYVLKGRMAIKAISNKFLMLHE